jgi:hypothetical protein
VDHKATVHRHLHDAALAILEFVRTREPFHADRWVPIVEVKNSLALNLVAVSKSSKQYGEKGWVFASLARLLEDEELLEYKREGSRSFCRSSTKP